MKWCWLVGHDWLNEYKHMIHPDWKNDWVPQGAEWIVIQHGGVPTGKRKCRRCGEGQ